MCTIEFITLASDMPFGVCHYLLARFIIFCFFAGLAVIFGVCVTEPRDDACVIKLWVLALGLELMGLFIALAYATLAVIILTELVCAALSLVFCCCIFPLANRAASRRGVDIPMDHSLISIIIVAVACSEGFNICCGERGIVPETDGGGEVVPQNVVKSGVAQVLTAARAGINVL